jgi:hypothetical protein
MAHFARIKNGIVDFVTVGRDDDENREDELAHDGWIYKRTSYNTRGGVHYTDGQPSADQSKAFRKNYAGLGYTLIPSVMLLFLLSLLRHGYSTKSHACGKPL